MLSPDLNSGLKSHEEREGRKTGVIHFTRFPCHAGRQAVMLNAPCFNMPEGEKHS